MQSWYIEFLFSIYLAYIVHYFVIYLEILISVLDNAPNNVFVSRFW